MKLLFNSFTCDIYCCHPSWCQGPWTSCLRVRYQIGRVWSEARNFVYAGHVRFRIITTIKNAGKEKEVLSHAWLTSGDGGRL